MTTEVKYTFIVRSWQSSCKMTDFMVNLKVAEGYEMNPASRKEHSLESCHKYKALWLLPSNQ